MRALSKFAVLMPLLCVAGCSSRRLQTAAAPETTGARSTAETRADNVPDPIDPATLTLFDRSSTPATFEIGEHRYTSSPGTIVAEPGEEVSFEVRTEPMEGLFLGDRIPLPAWVRWTDPSEAEQNIRDGVLSLTTVVGASKRRRILIYRLVGPRVVAHRSQPAIPVEMRSPRDHNGRPGGLVARADGRHILVSFAFGSGTSEQACSASVVDAGGWSFVDAGDHLRLVGFVEPYFSDSCFSPATPETPRLELEFLAPRPGPVDVVVFSRKTCAMCRPPQGYERYEERVVVGP